MKGKTLVVLAAAAASFAVTPTAVASTSDGSSHCPGGQSEFISWDINTEPYQADNRTDHNGNGLVCAKPTDKTFVEGGVTYTIYIFIDDTIR
jgi:hypothetical protein